MVHPCLYHFVVSLAWQSVTLLLGNKLLCSRLDLIPSIICWPFDAFVQTRLLLGTIKVQPLLLDVKHGAFARTLWLSLHYTPLTYCWVFLSFQKHIIVFLRRLGYIQSRKSLVPVTALATCPAASTIVMSSGIHHRKCSLLPPAAPKESDHAPCILLRPRPTLHPVYQLYRCIPIIARLFLYHCLYCWSFLLLLLSFLGSKHVASTVVVLCGWWCDHTVGSDVCSDDAMMALARQNWPSAPKLTKSPSAIHVR
jgi:hypothetical protein